MSVSSPPNSGALGEREKEGIGTENFEGTKGSVLRASSKASARGGQDVNGEDDVMKAPES